LLHAWLGKKSFVIRKLMFFVGSVGFVANSMVIPILCTKKMNSIFNHNLIYLAIFDNIYVLCAILECIRKYFLATQIQTVNWIHYYRHLVPEKV